MQSKVLEKLTLEGSLPNLDVCYRIMHPGPDACPCCGGAVFGKLGEDVTGMLERVPASWRVIQHVRRRFSCRVCETLTQAPAPFHPISRGRAGPELLAEVAFSKFGLHLPLHWQSERFAREGVPTEVSTRRAAAMYTFIETAKLNGVNPRAWLADVLARLPGHSVQRVSDLLPGNWSQTEPQRTAA